MNYQIENLDSRIAYLREKLCSGDEIEVERSERASSTVNASSDSAVAMRLKEASNLESSIEELNKRTEKVLTKIGRDWRCSNWAHATRKNNEFKYWRAE
jgi:hypothetical protein